MNKEIRKYLEMFISMSTDCIMGGITPQTFLANAEIALLGMSEIVHAGSKDGSEG